MAESGDPLSYLAGAIYREVHGDDDSIDSFYRAMGHSESEIASYAQTRWMMRQMCQCEQCRPKQEARPNG